MRLPLTSGSIPASAETRLLLIQLIAASMTKVRVAGERIQMKNRLQTNIVNRSSLLDRM